MDQVRYGCALLAQYTQSNAPAVVVVAAAELLKFQYPFLFTWMCRHTDFTGTITVFVWYK